MKTSPSPTASDTKAALSDRSDLPEMRPLQEFEGENRELFLRAFFEFGNVLLRDFKTGNPEEDQENEYDESFRLEWLLTRALFAAYAALQLLGIEPKRSVTHEFAEELTK